jgi:predicted  nucleic acid-binding Zn-ribbon protein
VRNAVRDDLSDYFTHCRQWFETQQSRHVAAKREIEKAMNLLDARRDFAIAIASRAADQERSLKVAYRQAHRRTRNANRDRLGDQAACPAYFDEIVTPQLPSYDMAKEREQAQAAMKTIDNNITALNICREWLEQHIQHVQQGLSSIEKKVAEEIGKVREVKQVKGSTHVPR